MRDQHLLIAGRRMTTSNLVGRYGASIKFRRGIRSSDAIALPSPDYQVAFLQRRLRRCSTMRTLAMAVAVLALVAVPAQAQMVAGSKRGHKADETKAEDQKPKVDDKAYQEALKHIPDPKEKYDPWAVTKTPDAAKKPSK
jgi:hypothetical protein